MNQHLNIWTTCAVLMAVGLMGACTPKGETDEADTMGVAAAVDSNTAKMPADGIYDVVQWNDTLLVVCDPEGLFYGQPLAGWKSKAWIDSAYARPGLRTLGDEEMFPHVEGDWTCGSETYSVVSEHDTLLFEEYEDTCGNTGWEYVCGVIADSLIDFAGIKVGMEIGFIDSLFHLGPRASLEGYRTVMLVAPSLFDKPVYEKQPNGRLKFTRFAAQYDYTDTDAPRIEYAGVKLEISQGRVTKITTGWYRQTENRGDIALGI